MSFRLLFLYLLTGIAVKAQQQYSTSDLKNGKFKDDSSYTAKDINKEMLKEEIGGIAIYLDLLASLLDISFEEAMIDTFNSKSEKYGFSQFVKPL